MSLIAFAARPNPPALEIRVNFGMFAGREATPAELDALARALLPEVGQVAVVAEHRHEVGAGAEASLHQVRIEVDDPEAPVERLVAIAERWAEACFADRRLEPSEP